jgi:hypothetical protein
MPLWPIIKKANYLFSQRIQPSEDSTKWRFDPVKILPSEDSAKWWFDQSEFLTFLLDPTLDKNDI